MKSKSRFILGPRWPCCRSPHNPAAAVAYKADKTVGDKELKGAPVSISVDSKDTLYILTDNGNVALYDADGKVAGAFKAAMDPAPTAMTAADGKIYLFNTRSTTKEVEFRGKGQTPRFRGNRRGDLRLQGNQDRRTQAARGKSAADATSSVRNSPW